MLSMFVELPLELNAHAASERVWHVGRVEHCGALPVRPAMHGGLAQAPASGIWIEVDRSLNFGKRIGCQHMLQVAACGVGSDADSYTVLCTKLESRPPPVLPVPSLLHLYQDRVSLSSPLRKRRAAHSDA